MQVVRANKLKCLSGVIALCLLMGVIAVAGSSGNSSASQSHVVAPSAPNAAQRTYALLEGIPQHGEVLGYRSAPVTLQFFGDLQCKESRQAMLGPVPELIRRFVRSGKLKIRFRSDETDTKGAGGWLEFREQQSAALAAGKQGKLWNFIDVFYREQGPEFTGYVNQAFLEGIARQAGLDMERWAEDRGKPWKWVGRIEADERLHEARRLQSTPSFLIGPTGGRARVLRHFGLQEAGVFEAAVERLL